MLAMMHYMSNVKERIAGSLLVDSVRDALPNWLSLLQQYTCGFMALHIHNQPYPRLLANGAALAVS